MKLLHAATLTIADLGATIERYTQWFDYNVAERGTLNAPLAASWGVPGSTDNLYAILQPSSGAEVYLRFVEQKQIAAYAPLRSFGWAAIEICVEDVLAVAERMAKSPFEIIGPPREIDGLPAIYPMQVMGPDKEIVYLTQIRDDLPAYDLPRAASFIDKFFIAVLACSNMKASIKWFEENAGLSFGREMEIEYTMLANSFGKPLDTLYTIATMVHERDVFLEFDQYPDEAISRPTDNGKLAPGVSIVTLKTPDIKKLSPNWIVEPQIHKSLLYDGKLAGCKQAPDGTLVEIVEAI